MIQSQPPKQSGQAWQTVSQTGQSTHFSDSILGFTSLQPVSRSPIIRNTTPPITFSAQNQPDSSKSTETETATETETDVGMVAYKGCEERTFGREHELKRHYDSKHSGQVLSCPWCPRKETRKDKMKDHCTKHHPNESYSG
ncbi:hypothetical protein EK21DRAFT_89869 [Setomelanomma holmii]|uniref:C2H2-type domain-containing protein n=1 Tax=Setomelanomma holmii TaxID=210430 RepID=A0A9P4H925_9PLEO|nr:hypothetical protein EK21DRAFT_89869 [Setomelanomma holmii]